MCHYSKTKETFWSFSAVLALQKNSPYTDSISYGSEKVFFLTSFICIFKKKDYKTEWSKVGLIAKWQNDLYPKDVKCAPTNRCHSRRKETLILLSLGHLSGAFVILLIGYSMTLLVFIGERTVVEYKCRTYLVLIAYLKAHWIFILELGIAAYNCRKQRQANKIQQTKINKLKNLNKL